MYTNNLDDAFSTFASGSTEEWVKSDKYMDYPEYHDEEYTYIEGRTIGDITAQVSVQGEAYSQYISFMIDRYYDGIDLIGMSIWIHYELKDGSGSEDSPVNVMYNDSTIRFGWVIPEKATQQSGDIKIGVWVNGTAPNTKAYILKTEEKIYTIHPGLIPGSGITQPDQTWFENFVVQMNNKVSTAQGYADDAQASRTEAAGSATAAAQSATASAQALQDNKDYVESQKETFVGYNRRETDIKYANALVGSASGTGRVNIGDAWEAPIPGMDISGRSEQFSTTGAQLLDVNAVGNYYINGQGNASSNNIWIATDYIPVVAGQQYKLTTKDDKYLNAVVPFDIDKKLIGTILVNLAQTKGLFTAPENAAYIRIRFYNDGGDFPVSMLEDAMPMLNAGATPLPWEPYTGGKPSPSPEYPQPIKGTGTVSTGANLLPYPYNDKTKVMNGITFTDNGNGSVTINGTSTGVADFNFTASSKVPLSKGTLKSLYSSPEKAEEVWCQYDIYDGGGTYLGTVQGGQTIQSDDMMYLWLARIRVKSGITVTNATIRPMLCLDSHHGTWEPYTGGKPSPSAEYPQPLDVTVTGAQLLDLTHAQGGTNGGITIVVNKDGSYTCSGTATNSDINVWFLGKYMEEAPTQFILKSGTYYKSGIRLFNGRKIIGPIFDGEFTIAEDTPVTGVRALQLESGKTYSNYTVYPMINAGSTALPWQPYESCTATVTLTEPLHGIGDVRDRIMCRDGVWGIEQQTAQIILNGSENWNDYQSTFNGLFGYNVRNRYKTQSFIFSDYYGRPKSPSSYEENKAAIDNYANVWIVDKRYTDVAALKNGLKNNPITIVAELVTPTWEPLPSDTQSTLNALTTYTGTTHVTITAGGPEPDVGLGYVMDTNIVIAELKKLIEGMQSAKS
ncbi:hypothetical protein [Enterocloster hominis (ex Hitch et al. 2024)]|uniref:Uncharacterized protein n=1 Tax=Enterocloster hominis (ex Hitch et al. 2024) TaxID=1917870 RepID=A0ABV1D428_9FIRM